MIKYLFFGFNVKLFFESKRLARVADCHQKKIFAPNNFAGALYFIQIFDSSRQWYFLNNIAHSDAACR